MSEDNAPASIITVTANPGLDLTYTMGVDGGEDADLRRAQSSTLEASGKGINVSRALTAVGVPTVAVLPVGGATGRCLVDLLDADGVAYRAAAQGAWTRINTSVLAADQSVSKVNGSGGVLEEHEQERLLSEVDQALSDTGATGRRSWLVVCGSLPPGATSELVRELVRLARRHEFSCAVDLSGDALRVALQEGVDLAAPNQAELGAVSSAVAASATPTELADAAHALAVDHGTRLLVTLGADGALYADGERVLFGSAPALQPINTAGAGDALLAGWFADGGATEERLARAVRWGRSACLSPTTVDERPGLRDDAEVRVLTVGPTPRQKVNP
ncbi:1-phosphofructokinase family hexose kinase [Demetria terragena]|uniref:1-phosphofructokinase family hexose kinase n=1 Tax=Demetria terragena TaxID=63959 RepID=UPI000366C1AB|nr:PfkB family carbohydrate kinase [Demetria terragena]